VAQPVSKIATARSKQYRSRIKYFALVYQEVNPASADKTTAPSTTRIVISFIVPAYNEEAELPGTLRAIRSAAGGYEHEIVLVNDGSTDATGAIGEEFGARVISIERRQIAAARNAGARTRARRA
jgi:cellulose synthase/poly-beta-1,6-N-acetylglucosamine synthase-like glycosyltransferase